MTIQLIASLGAKGGEVFLEAYPVGWEQFANALESNDENFDLFVPKDITPAPYDTFMTKLQIFHDVGDKVLIGYHDDVLSVSGSTDMLGKLAQHARYLATNPERSNGIRRHLHFDYYPDHFVIHPLSLPAVLNVVDPKEKWPVQWMKNNV
jgi:hypothetical protein